MTIDCPRECTYLLQARRQDSYNALNTIDRSELFPQIEVPADLSFQREPLVLGLCYVILQAAQRDRSLTDRDVIGALTSLAKAYETLVSSGLIYEAPSANPVQQGIATELKQTIEEYRKTEQKQLGYFTLRDAEALKVMVWMVGLAYSFTSGRPLSRGFIDHIEEGFPQKNSVIAGPEESESGLILP